MFLINYFKKGIRFIFAFFVLLACLPLIIIFSLLIYFEDKSNPFYLGIRVGQNFELFKLYKLRSMIVRKNVGFQSTSSNDDRILKIGKIIRRTKIDELPQILNVLLGNINFVGPRPNVQDEVKKYTNLERILLNYKPGITDFSSIIFSDEGDILKNSEGLLENLNLDLEMRLKVSENIPWYAAIFGGIPALAGGLFFENIFDERLDDVSTFKFKLSGSIEEPIIERLD